MDKKINVVVVGLNFGGEFAKIYKEHPNVESIGICDLDSGLTRKVADECDIHKTYSCLEDVLHDDNVDAVHLNTPIPLHEEHTIAVLNSGKHCACAVPMAMSLEGIRNVIKAVKNSGKKYMMMETALYTYQFFYIKQMLENGALGKIQFMRGTHYQDMIAYPDYWKGLPPMHYSTHAIAPMVALAGAQIERVHCFGSGTMDPELHKQYGNPFPVECALLAFENGMKAEATRSMFEVAKIIQEGLFVYGSKASFEWGMRYFDDPYVTTVTGIEKGWIMMDFDQLAVPNYADKLPQSIRHFTAADGHYDPDDPCLPLPHDKASMHHGSHPHLVHEFVMSIIENRKPYVDEILSGNINAAGICAHESAMKNGAVVIVPRFS